MTLVDTSVWIDHLRRGVKPLAGLLEANLVLMHPFVLGELACGNLADRANVLGLFHNLPRPVVAEDEETLKYIERHQVHGRGIGYIDAHLLASVSLTGAATLWTRDKRLLSLAEQLGLAHLENPSAH